MQWIFNGKEIDEKDLDGYVGFVYEITNLTNNKKYIGKKLSTKSKIYQKNKKKKKKRVSSNWKDYYGSSEILLEEIDKIGKKNFRRTILYLCKTKSEMSYYEAKEQIINDAIISEEYYNDWISIRITRSHLKNITHEKKSKESN